MVARAKFDPTTTKVAFRAFTFNGVPFAVGEVFDAKKAKVAPRQLKGLYNARLIDDKKGVKVVAKTKELTEAEELANAVAEQHQLDNLMIMDKLGHAKASILQRSADIEAEEAYEAQEKANAAKDKIKARKAKQARDRRAKAKASKEASKI